MTFGDDFSVHADFLTEPDKDQLVGFLLHLGVALSTERKLENLLTMIVDKTLDITNADGCTLYLKKEDDRLHFTISKSRSLNISIGGDSGQASFFPSVPMEPAYVSAYSAINNTIVNIADVYTSTEFDFTGPKKYDRLHNYRSVSMLVSPLTNHEREVIGVMQLLNALDQETGAVTAFDRRYEAMIQSLSSYAAMAISNFRLLDESTRRAEILKEANLDAIYSLAMAAEAKDDDTGDHIRRIQMFSTALAREIGLSDEEADEIGYSSIMHDVGKISIPDNILKKPASLSSIETELMKNHAMAGSKILPSKPFFKVANDIARHHHEKWDGSGYPEGLEGEDIPLPARIVAVTDVFDALTNRRSYKDSWPLKEAMEEMRSAAGTHFDPNLIDAWERLHQRGTLTEINEKWDR